MTHQPAQPGVEIKKEYILCAAIWFDDGKGWVHQPVNIKSGFVICGHRHHNCFMTLALLVDDQLERLATRQNHTQGSLTNLNRFVDRAEAANLAFSAAQAAMTETLFSEDLY